MKKHSVWGHSGIQYLHARNLGVSLHLFDWCAVASELVTHEEGMKEMSKKFAEVGSEVPCWKTLLC